MTRREYANYERDFDALTGEAAPRSVRILTGAASVPALKATGAPKHVLRHAWVLADADRDGNLTFDEFTVAMYLCERAAEGCELPQTLDAYAPGEFPPREEDETAQSSSDAARIVDVPATVRSRERDREKRHTRDATRDTRRALVSRGIADDETARAARARVVPKRDETDAVQTHPARFDDRTPRRSNRGGGGGGGGGGTASPSNRSRTRL